jgi:hypothetical protein
MDARRGSSHIRGLFLTSQKLPGNQWINSHYDTDLCSVVISGFRDLVRSFGITFGSLWSRFSHVSLGVSVRKLSTMPWRRMWSGGIALLFLTSILDGGDWWASCPGYFTPSKEPLYPLDKRLGGPQSRSGRCGEEKFSSAYDGNRTPAVQPVTRCYTDWAIPAPTFCLVVIYIRYSTNTCGKV